MFIIIFIEQRRSGEILYRQMLGHVLSYALLFSDLRIFFFHPCLQLQLLSHFLSHFLVARGDNFAKQVPIVIEFFPAIFMPFLSMDIFMTFLYQMH